MVHVVLILSVMSSEVSEVDMEGSSRETSESDLQASLFRFLCSPTASQLARKHRIQRNPSAPPTGTKCCKSATSNDPNSVKPLDRVNHLTVEAGNLFCSTCWEELSTKKSIIDLHIKSAKHLKGIERVSSKQKKEESIVEALKRYDHSENPVGETLPDSVRVSSESVMSLMKAGISLSKINDLHEIFDIL